MRLGALLVVTFFLLFGSFRITGVKSMSSLDVSNAVLFIGEVVIPVTAVGFALMMVHSTLRAIGFFRAAVGDPIEEPSVYAKEDRKTAEFHAAASDHGGVEAYGLHLDQVESSYREMWAEQAQHAANTAEYDRLADVWQGWRDSVESARAAGGVSPGAAHSLDLYERLVGRGMDPVEAIAAVEARNSAVASQGDREARAEEAAFRASLTDSQRQERSASFDDFGNRRGE